MSPFGVVCEKCGSGMPAGVRYCGSCGTSIRNEAAPPKKEDSAPQRTAGVGMLLVTWGLGLLAGFLIGRAFAPGTTGEMAAPGTTAPFMTQGGAAPAAGDAAAQVNFGIARLALGDEDGARRAFEAALLAVPPHPAAAYNMALIEEEAGRVEAARTHYARYLALAPEGPKAEHARAVLGAGTEERP